MKVFDNSIDIIVTGADAPPSVEELKQNMQKLIPHFDDVALKVNLSQDISVVSDKVENAEE